MMDIGKHLACLLRLSYRLISSIKFFLTKPCLYVIVGILDPNYLKLETSLISCFLLLMYESQGCKDGDLFTFISPDPSSGPGPQ